MGSLIFNESELAHQIILAIIVSFVFGPMGLIVLGGGRGLSPSLRQRL